MKRKKKLHLRDWMHHYNRRYDEGVDRSLCGLTRELVLGAKPNLHLEERKLLADCRDLSKICTNCLLSASLSPYLRRLVNVANKKAQHRRDCADKST